MGWYLDDNFLILRNMLGSLYNCRLLMYTIFYTTLLFGIVNCTWVEHRGLWYYISTGEDPTVNYTEATNICAAMNARLVVIANQDQNDFLSNTTALSADQEYWIGLSDKKIQHTDNCNEADLVWNNDWDCQVKFSNVESFDVGDSYGCVVLSSNQSNWNVKSCEEQYGFICQWECREFYQYVSSSQQTFTGIYTFNSYEGENIKYTNGSTVLSYLDGKWFISHNGTFVQYVTNNYVPYCKHAKWTKLRDDMSNSESLCIESKRFKVLLSWDSSTHTVYLNYSEEGVPIYETYNNDIAIKQKGTPDEPKWCFCGNTSCDDERCGYIFPYPHKITSITLDNDDIVTFTNLDISYEPELSPLFPTTNEISTTTPANNTQESTANTTDYMDMVSEIYSTMDTATDDGNNDKFAIYMYVGVAIGIFIVVVLLIALPIVICCRRHDDKKQDNRASMLSCDTVISHAHDVDDVNQNISKMNHTELTDLENSYVNVTNPAYQPHENDNKTPIYNVEENSDLTQPYCNVIPRVKIGKGKHVENTFYSKEKPDQVNHVHKNYFVKPSVINTPEHDNSNAENSVYSHSSFLGQEQIADSQVDQEYSAHLKDEQSSGCLAEESGVTMDKVKSTDNTAAGQSHAPYSTRSSASYAKVNKPQTSKVNRSRQRGLLSPEMTHEFSKTMHTRSNVSDGNSLYLYNNSAYMSQDEVKQVQSG